MLVGYARTSTVEQVAGFDAQVVELTQQGCEKIFREQVSSIGDRKQLDAAMDFVREGDTFVVTKLDRLARNVRNLIDINDQLAAKSVALKIVNLSLDTSTPTGKMMLTMLAAVGQFEREIMLERQKEGVAKAQKEGKYKGRSPTAMARVEEVRHLITSGLTKQATADKLGIGVASVYRIMQSIAKQTPT
jgi:DNA invertase Pin-like site-specific DNA recombinase